MARKVRRSHTISPFGVGAIYDFGEESFVAMDITQWKGHGGDIHLKRLEDALGKRGFRLAPVPRGFQDKNPGKVPFARFPAWLFCPRCRIMVNMRSQDEAKDEIPSCRQCAGQRKSVHLAPMRFVLVCAAGHLGDIPWHAWAHSEPKREDQRQCKDFSKLKFMTSGGAGGGLESLRITCGTCGASRSLEKLSTKDSMETINWRCRGKQPWQHEYGQCGEIPQVVQRGASNVYYPEVESALDIPCDLAVQDDEETKGRIRAHATFDAVNKLYGSQDAPRDDAGINALVSLIASDAACNHEDVWAELEGHDRNAGQVETREAWRKDILADEFNAFVTARNDARSYDPFVTETVFQRGMLPPLTGEEPSLASNLADLLDRIVIAHRLREVRVLKGFRRYSPDSEKAVIPPSLGVPTAWLPGVEVFGEGIFLSLREDRIADWQRKNSSFLMGRLAPLRGRHAGSGLSFLPPPTPRFLLLHTLSHMLIRQLAFECGYSASSLRERIYAFEPSSQQESQAGILIYTADTDAEGSLGGLARQGRPDRFAPTLVSALRKAMWCSGDPICSELPAQGVAGLNRAACHACALISETSCAGYNLLLDRAVLVGTPEDRRGGFFSEIGLWGSSQ